MQTLTLANRRLDQFYDVYITSDTFLNSPEIAYEAYEVPNVNGALLKYDKRLNNVIRRFDCFCKSNVTANLEGLKQWIYTNHGYMRIESSYDPNVYQMGYLAEGIEFTPFDASGAYEAQFSLYFSCKPQKYVVPDVKTTKESLSQIGDKLLGVFSRNSDEIKRLFASMPVELIPDAEAFAVVDIASANSRNDTFTNMTANVIGGDPWICLAGCNTVNSKRYLTCINASPTSSVTASTYTSSATAGEVSVCAVVPIHIFLIGDVNGSATVNGSTKTLTGIATARDGSRVSLQNTSAFGVKTTLRLGFTLEDTTPSQQQIGTFVLGRSDRSGGSIIASCSFHMHFERMTSAMLTDLMNNYTNPSGYFWVEVDENYKAYAATGTKKMNLTPYLEVNGDMCGEAQTVYLVGWYYPPNSGIASAMELNCEWWKL